MHAHPTQPHYAPASVGALMDPEFLRGAVIDANGDRHAEGRAPVPLRLRWQVVVHAVAAVFRRH
jgi:hypothetical protein